MLGEEILGRRRQRELQILFLGETYLGFRVLDDLDGWIPVLGFHFISILQLLLEVV